MSVETLEISTVVYRGSGLSRTGGIVTFIPRTLPGEKVAAEIVSVRKNFRIARLVEVLEPSPDRIASECLLADGTPVPGCAYDFARYEAEVALKDAQLRDFLRPRLAGGGDGVLLPPFASPRPLHYRNKAVFHLGFSHGVPVAGYLGDDNRTIVDVPSCPLAAPEIDEEWRRARGTLLSARPLCGSATLRRTDADGVVAWTDAEPPPPGARLTERSPIGDLAVPADGFYQVNPAVSGPLVKTVRDWVAEAAAETGADVALDLFCGVGVFGLAAAKAGLGRVVGVESSRPSVKCATHNAKNLGVAAAEFHCMDVARYLAGASASFPWARAVAIVDPPRAGIPRAALDALLASPLRRAVFVSCNPSTLARDLAAAAEAGFTLRRARLFDMFPRTIHFETAVLLSRD